MKIFLKKSVIEKIFIFVLGTFGSLMFFSCATTAFFTDALSVASAIATDQGYGDTGKILNAASTTTKAMEDITPENEYYIGRAVAATVLVNYNTLDSLNLELYLNKIVNALAIHSDANLPYNGYHVKILDSNELNAFATSGGHIFITKGLVDSTSSEDELAAALAHEMSHIQLKHSLKSIKSSRWTAAGLTAWNTAVTVGTSDGEDLDDMVSDQISTMMSNGYSYNQEYDADKNALELLSVAGYSPKAMVSMLETLNQISGSKGTGLFKTHPKPKSRIEKVNKAMEKISIPDDTTSYRMARFAAKE